MNRIGRVQATIRPKRSKPMLTVCAAASLLVLTRSASCLEQGGFGQQGQIALGVERISGFAAEHWQFDSELIDPSGTEQERVEVRRTNLALLGYGVVGDAYNYALRPRLAADYFPVAGLSVGLAAAIGWYAGVNDHQVSGSPGTSFDLEVDRFTAVFVHPRMGYVIGLIPSLELWPRAGLTWASIWATEPDDDGIDSETTTGVLTTTLEAPLVLHPVEPIAILLGPFAELGLWGDIDFAHMGRYSEQTTQVSVQVAGAFASVLGYWP